MKKRNQEILHGLFVELVKLQQTIIASNLKVLIILEGRDAAGKDGTIKRIIQHLSPRDTRVVALAKPSDGEQRQWYFQRYTAQLPAEGELVLFNRSWYNRAGVEKVMGFCTNKEYKSFFSEVELFEKGLVDGGFQVIKYYLDIHKKEQVKRLKDRVKNPLKQWKISPIDEVAVKHWHDYSVARNEMLKRTNFTSSPWFVVNADIKMETHIALITHLLGQMKYHHKNEKMLINDTEKVYPASDENLENRLFQ